MTEAAPTPRPPTIRQKVRSYGEKASPEPIALRKNSQHHPDATDPVGQLAGEPGTHRAAQQRRGHAATVASRTARPMPYCSVFGSIDVMTHPVAISSGTHPAVIPTT